MISAARVYQMLGNETLWQTAERCHLLLSQAGIPYAICRGVAVCLHGYQRNTVDLDLLIARENAEPVRQELQNAGLMWHADACEFRSESGVAVQFLYVGDRAGRGSECRMPDPGVLANITQIANLPALSLSRLVESKLACGEGSVRRMHRDFADVVELIAIHKLDSGFARHLHKSLRRTYRELVQRTRAEDPQAD